MMPGLKALFINSAALLIIILVNMGCWRLSILGPNPGYNPAELLGTSDPTIILVNYKHFRWEHVAPVSQPCSSDGCMIHFLYIVAVPMMLISVIVGYILTRSINIALVRVFTNRKKLNNSNGSWRHAPGRRDHLPIRIHDIHRDRFCLFSATGPEHSRRCNRIWKNEVF